MVPDAEDREIETLRIQSSLFDNGNLVTFTAANSNIEYLLFNESQDLFYLDHKSDKFKSILANKDITRCFDCYIDSQNERYHLKYHIHKKRDRMAKEISGSFRRDTHEEFSVIFDLNTAQEISKEFCESRGVPYRSKHNHLR